MLIKFIKMSFKNILSFGSKPTVINFTNGLNLVTGKNGTGKSSAFLDVLSFGLFGRPYRDVKIEELVNRINRKNSEVVIEFIVNNNTYEITRGIKPATLNIKENGNNLELLSSKKLNQEEIESKIGINFKLFKQIISLSINHNEPFLDLTAAKKREIFEQIFNIDIISSILKVVKNDNKTDKQTNSLIENSISFLKDNITSDKIRIQDLIKTKQSFDENKQTDINEIEDKLIDYNNQISDLNTKAKLISEDLKSISEYDLIELKSSLKDINKQINENEFEIRSSKKKISFLEKNNVCEQCNSKITDGYKLSEIETLQNKTINHEDELKILNLSLSSLEKEIDEKQRSNQKRNEIKYDLKSIKDKYTNLISIINDLKFKKEIIKTREFEIDIDKIKEEYKHKCLEYKSKLESHKQIQSDIEVNLKLIEMLSDTGIKSYVYEQLIPILNYNINSYLKLFELPLELEFDKYMEVTLRSLNTFTDGVSYCSHSEGEKKRIDMAILLSFISVTKAIANWNCNLLIIDELLDSSIDEDGLDRLIDSLETMSNELEGLGIYIISHRLKKEYFNQFNSLIEVCKGNNKFSEIKYLKGELNG